MRNAIPRGKASRTHWLPPARDTGSGVASRGNVPLMVMLAFRTCISTRYRCARLVSDSKLVHV